MVFIYRERNCAENYAKFCLENGQICETALCRPNVSIRHSFVPDMVHCLLSACDLKVIFLQIMKHFC